MIFIMIVKDDCMSKNPLTGYPMKPIRRFCCSSFNAAS